MRMQTIAIVAAVLTVVACADRYVTAPNDVDEAAALLRSLPEGSVGTKMMGAPKIGERSALKDTATRQGALPKYVAGGGKAGPRVGAPQEGTIEWAAFGKKMMGAPKIGEATAATRDTTKQTGSSPRHLQGGGTAVATSQALGPDGFTKIAGGRP